MTRAFGVRGRRSGGAASAVVWAAAMLVAPLDSPAQAAPEPPHEITLAEAIEIALRSSPALRQSRSGLELAETDRLRAYGSFLPNMDLVSGFSTSGTGRLDETGQAFTTESYTAQLRASVLLFDGMRRFADVRAARRQVEAEEARYLSSEYATVLRVETAYYNAVANRELLRVERDRVERQRAQLDFVRQQLAQGMATRPDVLRSEVDLNNARLAVLTAENDTRSAEYALAEAMGVTERVTPAAEARLEAPALPAERAELESSALEGAPSVVAARTASDAARANVGAAKSTYLPTLSFSGGWAWRNEDFPPSNRTWSLSLSASYPLFNGLQREVNVTRARLQAENADASRLAAELALRTDLDDAYGQIETARAGIELAEQNVDLSREDLRVTRERYRLGVATILDLQASQIALRQAEVDLVRRRFDYRIGIARLEALVGRDLLPADAE